jgi:hypothetical protein
MRRGHAFWSTTVEGCARWRDLGWGEPGGRAVRDEDDDEVRWCTCMMFGADAEREGYVDWVDVLDTESSDGVAFKGIALPLSRDGVERNIDVESRSDGAAETLLLPVATLLTTLGPITPLPLPSTTSPSANTLSSDVVDPFMRGLSVSSELRGELCSG